jgi:hypothetical protein
MLGDGIEENFLGTTLPEFPMIVPENTKLNPCSAKQASLFPQTVDCVLYFVNLAYHNASKHYTKKIRGKSKLVNSPSKFSPLLINAWLMLKIKGLSSNNSETVLYRYMTGNEIYKYILLVSKQVNKKLSKSERKVALGILNNAMTRYKKTPTVGNKLYSTTSIIHIK